MNNRNYEFKEFIHMNAQKMIEDEDPIFKNFRTSIWMKFLEIFKVCELSGFWHFKGSRYHQFNVHWW